MRWHWYWPSSPRRRDLRRHLAVLGVGWATSPWRKAVQTLSLVTFLVFLFWVLWPYPEDAAMAFGRREVVAPESFLSMDPLVGISTTVASRTWHTSLVWAAGILIAGWVLPRLFCGYLCPLGTLIDLADWAVGRRTRRLHLPAWGRWTRIRYGVLAAVLASALAGTTLSGFVAPIPILTRGLAFALGPIQSRIANGAHAGNSPYDGATAGVLVLAAVLAAALLGPRFWCRVLCPTGAILSLAARSGLMRRSVGPGCTHCGTCEDSCSFGAIRADHSTRAAECAFCQQCGGACPTGAIGFVDRRTAAASAPVAVPATAGEGLTRRALLVGTATGVLGGLGAARAMARVPAGAAEPPVRPPGSLAEPAFLASCIRCASCIKGCPTGVLVPTGSGHGFQALWTPRFDADRAGCAPDCTICGQVCPTGAILPLSMKAKRAARVGLAVVDEATCLPHAGGTACRLCADACTAAGYGAIEFILVGVEMDDTGAPVEDTGRLAPVVIADRCTGCGLCQAVCRKVNVCDVPSLTAAAIVVRATATDSRTRRPAGRPSSPRAPGP
jgi:ferredoxin